MLWPRFIVNQSPTLIFIHVCFGPHRVGVNVDITVVVCAREVVSRVLADPVPFRIKDRREVYFPNNGISNVNKMFVADSVLYRIRSRDLCVSTRAYKSRREIVE